MAGSRDLTLAGYEVHRFGADDLRNADQARPTLTRSRTVAPIPMNAPGLTVLCRDLYAEHADPERLPLSARFDEVDVAIGPGSGLGRIGANAALVPHLGEAARHIAAVVALVELDVGQVPSSLRHRLDGQPVRHLVDVGAQHEQIVGRLHGRKARPRHAQQSRA